MPPTVEQFESKQYWDAMKRFAAMPKVYMKLSFLGATDTKWEKGDAVIANTVKLAQLFTPKKCMFATNFPVDNADHNGNWTMKDMLKTFHEIANNFEPEDQARLWRETAVEAYRMQDKV